MRFSTKAWGAAVFSALCVIACGSPQPPQPPAETPAAPAEQAAPAELAAPVTSVESPPSSPSAATVSAPPSSSAEPPRDDDPMAPLPGWPNVTKAAKPEGIGAGTATVAGRLHPSRIQSVVRAHFSDVRLCYEAGLKRKADLEGRVHVKFTIGNDGAVTSVADHGSDLSDPDVVACVLEVFRKLRFQPPQRGVVTVTYPLTFQPG